MYIYIYIYIYTYVYYTSIGQIVRELCAADPRTCRIMQAMLNGEVIISTTYVSEIHLKQRTLLEMGMGKSYIFSEFPKRRLLK